MFQILQNIDRSFSGVVEVVDGDLSSVRSGRAKPDLVARIPVKVESYGSTLTVQELANLSAPDSQTIVIAPWDKSVTDDIVRGISQSDLNLTPVVDGEVVRINIPALTHERRLELAKLVDKKIETGKVLLREERGRIKKEIDKEKGKPGVSQDDIYKAVEELDRKTKEWENKIEQSGEEKKEEVMKV